MRHLPNISPISRPYLAHISPISRPYLPQVRLLADSPVEVLDALSQVTRTLTLSLTLSLTLALALSYTLTLLDALRQAVGRYHPHSYTGGGSVRRLHVAGGRDPRVPRRAGQGARLC